MLVKKNRFNFKKNKISLRILIYKEDNQYIAHALEMDLKGYGDTKEEAEKELIDLIKIQISFAVSQNNPSLIYFPAEPKYFMLYERIKEQYLKDLQEDSEYSIDDMPLKNLNLPYQNNYAQSM